MNKMNKKGGFATAATLLLFLALVSALVATTTLALNAFKTSRSYETKEVTYTYSDYGLNKGKSVIKDLIRNAPREVREEYLKDMSKFTEDANKALEASLQQEKEENKNFKDVEVKLIQHGTNEFELQSRAVLNERNGVLTFGRTAAAPLTNVIEAMGDMEIIPGEMPDIDAAIVTESGLELKGGTIKGKTIILNPDKNNKIKVRNSFGGIQDSIVDGHVTKGKVYIHSKGGEITYDNVHEYFEFQGMPYDISAAEHLFVVGRHSNGQGYIVEPKRDKLEIVDENLALPNVSGLKDYSYINNLAKPYTIKELTNNRTFNIVDNAGNLTFPTSSWQYSNNNEIVYKMTENAYYPKIDLKDSSIKYVFDVGDKDIEIVTDTLHLRGHIVIRGSGSLTIYLTDKNINNPAIIKSHFTLNPRGIEAITNGKSDNRKFVIAIDTPASLERNPIDVRLQSWEDTSLSIIAEHLKLAVIGTIDVNALSWGKNSSASVESSSTFSSNLFYFKEGKIDYKANYFYGTLIGKHVDMVNTSPTIENNEKDTPGFDDFPLEISWVTPSGKPATGKDEIILGESQEGRLEFGRTKEVVPNAE